MTVLGLASSRRTLRLGDVTTGDEDTQFDATDEAFFNAAEDAPATERPPTAELEAQELETDEEPADPVASERLRARRARLTQTVTEIVATLAFMAGTAFGMHMVRGPAASSRAEASSSPRVEASSSPTIIALR
jgi:hypothetical protein